MRYLFIIASALIVLTSCTSVDRQIIKPQEIKNIESWKIEFKNIDNVLSESKSESSAENRVVERTYSSLGIQFLEDIKFELMSNYNVNIVEKSDSKNGYMRINIVENLAHGSLKQEITSADITFFDNTDNLLGRIKVNTTSSPYPANRFAKDCAKDISSLF